MKRFLLIAAGVLCFIGLVGYCAQTRAQTAAPPTYTLQLTDAQITGIIDAGAACLEKMPYACARYTIYIHDLLTQARLPKPDAKKDP